MHFLQPTLVFLALFYTSTNAFVIEPRRGGGGGGKGGGGGSGGGGSGGSHGGGSTPRGSSSGAGSSSSSRGPTTYRSSSGGSYYAGGASSPYRAGSPSSLGLSPARLLLPAALGFWAGAWLFGAYEYPYRNQYTFYNESAATNQTKPIVCFCQEYEECGCDDNGDTGWLDDLVGDGSEAGLNSTVIQVADVNGTSTILLNGTLPNGTEEATSSGPSLKFDSRYALGWITLAAATFVML